MIVVANKPGQLGNRLFVFAHLIGLALSAGVRVANPAFDEYAASFQGTVGDPFCRYPPKSGAGVHSRLLRRAIFRASVLLAAVLSRIPVPSTRVVRTDWEEPFDLSGSEFEAEARARRLVFLQGWLFRHEAGVRRHREAIRSHLRPLRPIEAAVQSTVAGARGSADLLVGLHIRRGDYVSLHGGAYYYPLSTYADVAARLHARLAERGDVAFLVCSDEPWDADVFSNLACSVTPGSGGVVEDLYALAACDLLIGPPSTFSMWASYYGGTPLHILRDPSDALEDVSFQVFQLRGYPTSVSEVGPTYW